MPLAPSPSPQGETHMSLVHSVPPFGPKHITQVGVRGGKDRLRQLSRYSSAERRAVPHLQLCWPSRSPLPCWPRSMPPVWPSRFDKPMLPAAAPPPPSPQVTGSWEMLRPNIKDVMYQLEVGAARFAYQ